MSIETVAGMYPAHVPDPPQTLGQPRALATPLQRRGQDFDGFDQGHQVHAAPGSW